MEDHPDEFRTTRSETLYWATLVSIVSVAVALLLWLVLGIIPSMEAEAFAAWRQDALQAGEEVVLLPMDVAMQTRWVGCIIILGVVLGGAMLVLAARLYAVAMSLREQNEMALSQSSMGSDSVVEPAFSSSEEEESAKRLRTERAVAEQRSQEEARRQAEEAERAKEEARRQKKAAEKRAKEEERRQAKAAERAKEEARRQAEEAERVKEEARRQAKAAERVKEEARRQAEEAERVKEEARRQAKAAERHAKEEERRQVEKEMIERREQEEAQRHQEEKEVVEQRRERASQGHARKPDSAPREQPHLRESIPVPASSSASSVSPETADLPVDEAFSEIVEGLRSSDEPARLKAAVALGALGESEPGWRPAVTDMLVSYLQEHASLKRSQTKRSRLTSRDQKGEGTPDKKASSGKSSKLSPSSSGRPDPTIQAILSVLGGYAKPVSGHALLDLKHLYLCRYDLQGAHLEGADFKGARVYGARLRGAHLEGADLSAATGLTLDQLRSAHIDEATSLPRSVEEHRAEIGA